MQSGVTPRLLNVNRFKRRINRQDPVANIYRNVIDLNRFSNGVARQIVRDYNSIILSAVADLKAIDLGEATAGAGIVAPSAVQAQRLRVILAQLKESLDAWAGRSTAYATSELQGLAELQSAFVEEQIRLALRGGIVDGRELLPSQIDALARVNTVQVSPNFASSVASIDPTDANVVVPLSDARVLSVVPGQLPSAAVLNLTAAKGSAITLPNGEIIAKAFRGLAESQVQKFNAIVRTGVLTGEPTPQIARRLVGRLDFGQLARTARQQALAGGELTKIADHQVLTLIRTSVQQVSNAASQQVYLANPDITKKYQYVATLDSRTSAICRSLDGQEFEYGKGPQPPVHFNCRSTTIPVIDYEGLGIPPPEAGAGLAKRASAEGPVKGSLDYGRWLKGQTQAYQAEVFGSERRAQYFRKLANKFGSRDALVRMVREDGSEVRLEELKRAYGFA